VTLKTGVMMMMTIQLCITEINYILKYVKIENILIQINAGFCIKDFSKTF